MVLVDLFSKPSRMDLRATQDDVRFSGSAQGAVTGHTGTPNANIHRDAPPGSGKLYGGRKHRRRTRGRKRRRTRAPKRRTKKGGYYVEKLPGPTSHVLGPKAGHPAFARGSNPGFQSPDKLGAGIQYSMNSMNGGGGASTYGSHVGNSYYTTSMKNTGDFRGSYPEIVGQTHKGGRRRRKNTKKAKKSKKQRSRRRSRRRVSRKKKGGYHQYLSNSARSFGYLTNARIHPNHSALAGHGLMGAYKMGDYGMKGNYNHFTGKNT